MLHRAAAAAARPPHQDWCGRIWLLLHRLQVPITICFCVALLVRISVFETFGVQSFGEIVRQGEQLTITADQMGGMEARVAALERSWHSVVVTKQVEMQAAIASMQKDITLEQERVQDMSAELVKVFGRLGNFEGRIYNVEISPRLQSDDLDDASQAKPGNLAAATTQEEFKRREVQDDAVPLLPSDEATLYAPFVPRPQSSSVSALSSSSPKLRTTYAAAFTGGCARAEREWQVCDANEGRRAVDRTPVVMKRVPRVTKWGEHAVEFVDHVMLHAWGDNPPRVDLYVRAGRAAALQLRHLWKTVDAFWPTFLGDILLVLDVGDEAYVDALLPQGYNSITQSRHRFHVVYEHLNCMDRGTCESYSHLQLYRYTQADYVVAITPDCALHRPVTPDVLFNASALPIMPSVGHIAPVIVRPSTLREYAQWIEQQQQPRNNNTCLERQVSASFRTGKSAAAAVCWQCQISLYLAVTQTSQYDLMEEGEQQYVRYASRAEKFNPQIDVETLILQALCRHFGRAVFDECYAVEEEDQAQEAQTRLNWAIAQAIQDKLVKPASHARLRHR